MSWWVNELKHQLESIYHESQDQAAEMTGVRAIGLLVVELVTTTKRGLDRDRGGAPEVLGHSRDEAEGPVGG